MTLDTNTPSASKPAKPSHGKDLVLLFSIPAGIALLTALLVYIPNLLAKPQYDFIYVQCVEYVCKDTYATNSSGRINRQQARQDGTVSFDYSPQSSLRYYDVKAGSSKAITLDEVQQYSLNVSSKSPDGYTLSQESSNSGFLFWGDYNDGWYLKNGAKRKEVMLTTSDSYGSDKIEFLGWVNK